ncbi:hypothetical protein ACNKHN_09345 [Shigella flexneri]
MALMAKFSQRISFHSLPICSDVHGACYLASLVMLFVGWGICC